ncbi:MAG: hypothetical protein ACI4TB_09800 [Lachnospiraceae bacterium]
MKRLAIWKNKPFLICLLVELLLLLSCVGVMTFRENAVYTYGPETFKEDGAGSLLSEKILLPPGIYRVVLQYECDGNMQDFCNVLETEKDAGNLLCSGEHLSNGRGYTDFDLWIKAADTGAVVQISRGGDNLVINGLSIYQTDRDMTKAIFLLLVFSVILDTLLLVKAKGGFGCIAGKGVLFIIAVSSIPTLVNYAYPGSDVTYHLLRIGNLKDGLLSGQFPVRIDPSWLWGHGYANSICYGELLFYIPAFLRLIGFTLQGSYLIFLFVLNVGTCLVSYFSFKKIFQDARMGLLCSMLYTLSIYRLYKMYSWGALGEVQAMVFLPIILCAVYGIFAEETDAEGYKKKWIPLAVGFSGIVQCHILTCEMTVFFLAVACIILWKRLFRKETLLVFIKGVLGTCALSAWFVVPFLDYYLHVDMTIHHVSARTIQEVGLYPANLLFAFFHRGSSRNFAENGMQNMEALGVGITMTVAALLLLVLWFWGYLGKKEKKNRLVGAGKLSAILGILAMAMSLAVFPWTQIQFLNKVTESLVSSIQYPNRFLMIATILLTFVAGVAVCAIRGAFGKKQAKGAYAGFAVMAVVTALFYISSIVSDAGELYLYDEKGMGTGYLSGAEYLRYGVDQSLLSYHGPGAGEGVEIESYEKEWLDIDMTLHNSSASESYVEVPLQSYKGYVATVTETGEKLTVSDGSNFDLRITVPAGFTGEIQIRFVPPWYWRLSELVSAIALILLIAYPFHPLQKIKRSKALRR